VDCFFEIVLAVEVEGHRDLKPSCLASAVDLTFASVSLRGLAANVKSETALEIIFAGAPLVLTFVNVIAATPYECQNGDTSGVDLTFAIVLTTSSKSESQILNSTRNLYLLLVL
jgi:hypothetical protein